MKPRTYLRAIRHDLKMTQVELGKALGYSDCYISNLERGDKEKSPSFKFLLDLATVAPFHTFGEICEMEKAYLEENGGAPQ